MEWFAFIGGISVVFYMLGKIVNHLFLRKTYISAMLDKLFQIQNVAKISNVKKSEYSESRINEIASPYKSPVGSRKVQHINSARFNSKSSVKPLDPSEAADEQEAHKHQSEIDKYIAELGQDGADFSAFKKLCINRASLNPYRRGRLTRFLCCRAKPFDSMLVKAKDRIRDELDIVRYIKKQRMHTNLLWGLSTKWQRSLCRN